MYISPNIMTYFQDSIFDGFWLHHDTTQEINTSLKRQKKQNLWIYSLHSISVYMDYQYYSNNNNNNYNSNNVPADFISLVKCFPLLFEFLLLNHKSLQSFGHCGDVTQIGTRVLFRTSVCLTKSTSLYIT